MDDAGPLIEVRGLRKNFPGAANAWGKSKGTVQAVADVSFDIQRGEPSRSSASPVAASRLSGGCFCV